MMEPTVTHSITQAFESTVVRHPTRTAVKGIGVDVTYRALWNSVDDLARRLDGECASDRPVLVLAEHGVSTIVGVLAATAAGKTALVLDPLDPDEHLASIADRFGGGTIVADISHLERAARIAPGGTVVPVRTPGDADTASPMHCDRALTGRALPDPMRPATASLTSGTTGTAKAVVHSHRNVAANAARYAAANGVTSDDRILVVGPLSAQASATPVFTALLSGATLCTYDLRRLGVHHLASFARSSGVTIAHLPPATIGALPTGMQLPDVRLVSLGGDRVTARHLSRARNLFPRATLLHRYSTSETNWIGGWSIAPDEHVPEGERPAFTIVPWLRVRVVDDAGTPLGAGDVGEVEVTGPNVALGYLDDPERTAERFRTDGDLRTYRTGDRARLLDDGRLELVGRVDDVCKVRGVLVDPSSVERALEAQPDIDVAAVVTRTVGDRTELVAFVAGRAAHGWQVRARLAQQLPPALVPASVRILPSLPTTARGKIDKAALRSMASADTVAAGGASHREPPVGADELCIAQVFGDVLGVADMNRHDDLFDLGADSLAVIEILTRLEHALGRRISPTTLIEAPTPSLLAERLTPDSEPSGDEHRLRRAGRDVVRLRTGDTDSTPVVIFTGGGGGHLAGAAMLAQRLVDRTAYAVVPRGFDRRARPDRTVEAQAARAAASLTRLGHRRLILVGHSSGGNVALETARQMHGGSVHVAAVVLLDSLAMTHEVIRQRRFHRWLAWELADDRRQHPDRSMWATAVGQTRVARRFIGKRRRQWWLATTAGLVRRSDDAQHRAFEALVRRGLRRHREQPYPGDVVLVTADADPWRDAPDDHHWSQVGLGNLTIDVAGGPHSYMLTERHVAATAAAVERACRRVDALVGDEGSASATAGGQCVRDRGAGAEDPEHGAHPR